MKWYPLRFSESASNYPDNIALSVKGGALTYAELDGLTNRLAAQLKSFSGRGVAVCFSKSIECYLAQIAVLKVGGYFVPIDPNYPEDRIEYMLNDSGVDAVLVSSDRDSLGCESVEKIYVDLPSLKEGAKNGQPFYSDISGDDFAYMIYTSGSTGKPKGVPIHHGAILNHNQWCVKAYELNPDDRVLQFASISFDISIEEILPTFLAGATLMVAPDEVSQSMGTFFDWIEDHRVTVLNVPTAFWHEIVHYLKQRDFPKCVRLMVIGGEAVNKGSVEQWFEYGLEGIPLINAYGPTETTITSSVAYLEKDQLITIGKPIDGLKYEIWDEHQNQVDSGAEGELIISGLGVAKGYWNRPEETANQFITKRRQQFYRTGDKVRENSQGLYEFLGRIDDQVKVRGFRIEPGEIAEVIATHSQIDQSVVRSMQVNGSTELVGYFLATEGGGLEEAELRVFLIEKLPGYMVPKFLLEIDTVPISPSGKIDYSALPVPEITVSQSQDRMPSSPFEKKLAEVWRAIFAMDNVTVDADFFESGGDSIKALRLISLVENECGGMKIPIAALIENSTIEKLARFIETGNEAGNQIKPGDPVVTIINSDSAGIPIVAFHGAGGSALMFREFEDRLSEKHPLYIVESGLLHTTGKVELPDTSVDEIVCRYAAALLPLLKSKKVIFTGYSFGGILSLEMARNFAEQGGVVSELILIDTPNPAVVKRLGAIDRVANLAKLFFTNLPGFIDKLGYCLKNRRHRKLALLNEGHVPGEIRSVLIEDLYNQIEDEYEPAFYRGELSLIASSEPNVSTSWPDDYGWVKLLPEGGVSRFKVPGNHLSMIYPENLPQVVKVFKSIVEAEPFDPANVEESPRLFGPCVVCFTISGCLILIGLLGNVFAFSIPWYFYAIAAWLFISLGCVLAALKA